MLGRIDNSSPIPPPPDPRVIDGFITQKTGGPSKRLGQLRLDLDGPVRSPWNVRAARCFRKSFNKSQLYHHWQNSLVEEAFLRHIETIRTNYCKQIGRVTASVTLERQIRSARRSRVKTVSTFIPHGRPCLSDFTVDSQQKVHLQHRARRFPIYDLREPIS